MSEVIEVAGHRFHLVSRDPELSGYAEVPGGSVAASGRDLAELEKHFLEALGEHQAALAELGLF